MMHASARDFLLTNADLNYHIHSESAHRTLFCKCVEKLMTSYTTPRQHFGQQRGFIAYAASSWPFHLQASHGFEDLDSLSKLVALFQSHAVLDWICVLAASKRLRILIEASKTLTNFVEIVDQNSQQRSPFQHRLADKECIAAWAHDLVRIVAKFGLHMLEHPMAIYDLIPAFCPSESVMYKQFAPDESIVSLRVNGIKSCTWDDCFARFALPGDSLPRSIITAERHFAILTGDGIVRLYYANTSEEARSFAHGEPVFAFCFNTVGDRLATAGSQKTKIWDASTLRQLFTIDNPRLTKPLALCFAPHQEEDEIALWMFSDDNVLRSCSLLALHFRWVLNGVCLNKAIFHREQSTFPKNACFSPDGTQIAISYRGAHPAVWSVEAGKPEFVGQCERNAPLYSAFALAHTNYCHAQAFCWNPVSGHLLGTYNDGCVFKWHPRRGGYELSATASNSIKCSADGNLFVTSNGGGSLHIWDFEHFSPVYHLTFPQGPKDIDIDRNDARVYDIRDGYCNIWQPNALLRLMESDDKANDSPSSHERSNQPSLTEVHQDTFEPITALATSEAATICAAGNDAGDVFLFNRTGERVVSLEAGCMSVEAVACCPTRSLVAVADLGRDVSIHKICRTGTGFVSDPNPKLLSPFGEPERITKLLFDSTGTLILVVSKDAISAYETENGKVVSTAIQTQEYNWVLHPFDDSLIVGFGSEHLKISHWQDLTKFTTSTYDRNSGSESAVTVANSGTCRASEVFPLSPSGVHEIAEVVYLSCDSRFYFVQVRSILPRASRRTHSFLVETTHFGETTSTSWMDTRALPAIFTQNLNVPLGFVEIDYELLSHGRHPSTTTAPGVLRPISRSSPLEQIFVFINWSYWVCSVNLSPSDLSNLHIRRHFFLPRDWQSAEWLKLATVTRDGIFLCPRHGEVAAVSNWPLYEWPDI